MIFELRIVLRNLILPPSCLFVLGFAGLLLVRRYRGLGTTLAAMSLAGLWLLSTPVVAGGLQRMTEHYPALDLSRRVSAQAIVILGGGGYRAYAPEYGGPAPEYALYDRLAYGAYVARHTGLPVLVTGNGMEAVTMKASLSRDFGVQTKWLDESAQDTYDNAHDSARILHAAGIQDVVLVTSDTHLWRAAHEFEAAGLGVVPAPADVWAPQDGGRLPYLPRPSALLQSCEAVYALVAEGVRDLLLTLHLRHVVR
ncbi:MAG TPA: YdcF family protein [Steroidobacteraceae bacterium]|nr:YdcF family protein [Steroidobacteraceae bacterium]